MDMPAPANYSLLLDEPSALGRGLIVVYRSTTPVRRARTPDSALSALLAHLFSHLEVMSPEHVALDAAAVIDDRGEAILAPSELRNELPALEAGVRRRRWRLLDSPFALLAPETGDLIVQPPHSSRAVAVADACPNSSSYAVTRWVSFEGEARTGGRRLAPALHRVRNLAVVGLDTATATLQRTLEHATSVALSTPTVNAFFAAVDG